MFELFFGNLSSVLSTVLLIVIAVFIAVVAVQQKKIVKWGRLTLILAVTGLVLCCFVATRDDYVDALQGGAGVFTLDSIQIYLAYAGGAINGFAVFSSAIVRNQKYRKVMFFVLSGSIIFKAVLIEMSRIMMF